MPAFNAAQHIRQSIQSVFDQTYDDWELIIVDDGSTDGTPEAVAEFADDRIRFFTQANAGPAAARNAAISKARGSIVAFLDADDLWLPHKLQSQLRCLADTQVDLAYCDGLVFFENGASELSDYFAIVPGATRGREMVTLLYANNRIATQSVVVKRGAVERAGLFDERFRVCEDYDLWLRMARLGCTFYGMPEKLFRYRRREGSSTDRESKLLRPMIEVVKKHSDAVDPRTARARIRSLYRDLVIALIAENDITGARRAMREFAYWDRAGMVTLCQRIILRLFPSRFAGISRRCLYPIEWHLSRLL